MIMNNILMMLRKENYYVSSLLAFICIVLIMQVECLCNKATLLGPFRDFSPGYLALRGNLGDDEPSR